MKLRKKALAATVAAGFGLPFGTANALSPSIQYTQAQFAVCAPLPVTGSDAISDKANTGGKTITATSFATAAKNRVFDPRPGAVAYSGESFHRADNATLSVTKRRNGLAPTQYRVQTVDHRGKSLRIGRTVKAENRIVAMSVKATGECFGALGLI